MRLKPTRGYNRQYSPEVDPSIHVSDYSILLAGNDEINVPSCSLQKNNSYKLCGPWVKITKKVTISSTEQSYFPPKWHRIYTHQKIIFHTVYI